MWQQIFGTGSIEIPQELNEQSLFFDAGSVCRLLGYRNPSVAVKQYVDGDDVWLKVRDKKKRIYISDKGVCALICGSTKPHVKAIKNRLFTAFCTLLNEQPLLPVVNLDAEEDDGDIDDAIEAMEAELNGTDETDDDNESDEETEIDWWKQCCELPYYYGLECADDLTYVPPNVYGKDTAKYSTQLRPQPPVPVELKAKHKELGKKDKDGCLYWCDDEYHPDSHHTYIWKFGKSYTMEDIYFTVGWDNEVQGYTFWKWGSKTDIPAPPWFESPTLHHARFHVWTYIFHYLGGECTPMKW
jgi:BRO family, N-terminal domain